MNKLHATTTMHNKQHHYHYLVYLATLYITLTLVSNLTVLKIINIYGLQITASVFIFPATYTCSDIVTEVYGYRVARQLIWAGLICIFIFGCLCQLLLMLPPASDWHFQAQFNRVLGPQLRIAFGYITASLVGSFINIIAISRWKILMQGRFFWLRSIGSSFLGEIVFTVITCLIFFFKELPLAKTLEIIPTLYLFKICYAFAVSFLAQLVVRILKRGEKLDVYDYGVSYNPFKLSAK